MTPKPHRLRAPLVALAGTSAAVIVIGLTATTAGTAQAQSPPAVPLATATGSSGTPNTSPYPPGAPGNLTATGVTTRSVTLTWTASTPGCCSIAGYQISYKVVPNDVILRVDVGKVTTATITSGIAPATQYFFAVAAVDDMGRTSPSSNTIMLMTPNTDTGDTTPPEAPTNLVAATNTAATTAILYWSASTDNVGVTGYDVYRAADLVGQSYIATVTGTTYTVPRPASGTYRYFVRARDAAGNLSLWSNTVSVPAFTVTTPPTTPPSTPPTTPPSTPPTTSLSTPPTPPATCQVKYNRQAEWSHGFVASLTIRNQQTTPVDGWTLKYTFGGDQKITNSWSANFSQSGAAVTMTNLPWNATIAGGAGISIGIQGTWANSDAPPAAFTLNGAACAVG